jgi:hypothetical protein
MSSEPPDPAESGPALTPAAIAATDRPVQLSVQLVQDERVPEGMVCMGSFRNGRLIARSVMPPEAWGQIQDYHIFDEPVQVVLVARTAPPGLQCQLYAMVPLPEIDEEPEEPWAASVPGSTYEASLTQDEDAEVTEGADDPQVAPIPLGNIVRYTRDRVHPDSLPLEAVDVLRKIVDGETSELIDRALADLLGL